MERHGPRHIGGHGERQSPSCRETGPSWSPAAQPRHRTGSGLMGLTEEEWGQIQANLARNRPPAAAQAAPASTQAAPAKASKHRNRKVAYGGFWFDSQKECSRYQELLLFQRVGAIKD